MIAQIWNLKPEERAAASKRSVYAMKRLHEWKNTCTRTCAYTHTHMHARKTHSHGVKLLRYFNQHTQATYLVLEAHVAIHMLLRR